MSDKFTLADLFASANFESGHITTKELEALLRDTIKKTHPKDSVKKFKYTKRGIDIILKSNEKIQVDIDWNEIILS